MLSSLTYPYRMSQFNTIVNSAADCMKVLEYFFGDCKITDICEEDDGHCISLTAEDGTRACTSLDKLQLQGEYFICCLQNTLAQRFLDYSAKDEDPVFFLDLGFQYIAFTRENINELIKLGQNEYYRAVEYVKATRVYSVEQFALARHRYYSDQGYIRTIVKEYYDIPEEVMKHVALMPLWNESKAKMGFMSTLSFVFSVVEGDQCAG